MKLLWITDAHIASCLRSRLHAHIACSQTEVYWLQALGDNIDTLFNWALPFKSSV